jgi:hypothetical protein
MVLGTGDGDNAKATLTISMRELERLKTIERVVDRMLRVSQATEGLGISCRQVMMVNRLFPCRLTQAQLAQCPSPATNIRSQVAYLRPGQCSWWNWDGSKLAMKFRTKFALDVARRRSRVALFSSPR